MKIITTPDPRLRKKSQKISAITDDVKDVIKSMKQQALEWEKDHPYEISAAMAAPQLGINKRIIIIRDTDDTDEPHYVALINPEVIKAEGKEIKDYEGCLSVPFIYGLVPRKKKVKIKALLEDGTDVRLKAEDTLARTLLHEIDHLNGVLFIDHIKDDKDAFFRLEGEDMVPVDYDQEIKDNPELFPND